MAFGRILTASVVSLVLSTSACSGDSQISADTKCADYLGHPGNERSDAAIRISSELGVSDAGNPMWALSLDSACGSNREMTVRQAFGQ